MNQTKLTRKITMTKKLKVLSLFSNIGVAEAYLEDIGVDVVVANELIPRRAALYSKIYPKTNMICGDITLDSTMQSLISESKAYGVNLIMAREIFRSVSRNATRFHILSSVCRCTL